MILPLRQRHRRMVIVIGVLLPIAFAVGVVARKPAPGMAALPLALVGAPQIFAATEWERADLFVKSPIQVRLLRESASAGRFAVTFSVDRIFVKPDLMVYWAAGNPAITSKLPEDALLLGAFNSSVALPLPVDVASGNGMFVLYSLADNEVADISKPVQFTNTTK